MKANVGELRQQSALADADRPVIIISDDERLNELLGGLKLRVVEFYPDTTDGDGKWNSTFKIKVAIIEVEESAGGLHRRDAKRMKLGRRSIMKETPIASADVGKIFVADGKTGRIMTRDTFLALPIDSYDCWEEIGEFDVNQ